MAKEDRIEAILNASAKIFAQYGFDRSKIDNIAKEAGIGKGTIYGYFSSKDELFTECIKYYFKKYYIYTVKSIRNKTVFREKLLAFTKSRCDFLEKNYDFTKFIFTTSYNLPMDIKIWMLKSKIEVDTLVKEIIEKAVNNGELKSNLDVDIAASCFIGSYNQYCLKKIFIEGISPSYIKLEPMIDLLLKGWQKN